MILYDRLGKVIHLTMQNLFMNFTPQTRMYKKNQNKKRLFILIQFLILQTERKFNLNH